MTEWLSYDAEVHWVQINKDEQDFLNFIAEGVDLLEASEPPPPSPNCPWCNYIRKLKSISKIY